MLCLVLKCVFYLYLVERKVDFKTMNSSVKRKEYYERLGLDEGASTGVLCVSAEWSQFLLSVSSKHETVSVSSLRTTLTPPAVFHTVYPRLP